MSLVNAILPRVEFEESGRGLGWTDRTSDVVREAEIESTRGIFGYRPEDRTGRIGVMTFALNNSSENSAGLQNRYTPGHANALPGFGKGTGVRLSVLVGDGVVTDEVHESGVTELASAYVRWTGSVGTVEPEPGKGASRIAHVAAFDYFDRLAREDLKTTGVLQGVGEADAVRSLLDFVSVAPRDTEIGEGSDSYDFLFDLVRSEGTTALAQLDDICVSSLGTAYMKGNGTFKYEPRSEKRFVSGSSLTVDLSLTEDDDLRVARPFAYADNRRNVKNSVRTIITPRELDGSVGSEIVVAQLSDAIPFDTGEKTIELPFTDQDDRAERSGAISLLQPVENTDFDFNTSADGSGTDESANVTVTATFRGDTVSLLVDNSAGQRVYPVTSAGAVLLRVRGIGVISKEPVIFKNVDQSSIDDTDIGENSLTVDLPYQSEPAVADAIGAHLKDTLPLEGQVAREVSILLNPEDEARSKLILDEDISSLVTITETMTGLDGTQKSWVNGERMHFDRDSLVWVDWSLAPAHAGFSVAFGSGHLWTGGNGNPVEGAETELVSAEVTLPADTLGLAWVSSVRNDGTNPGVPSVSGLGATWVQVATVVYDGVGGTYRARLTLFRTMLAAAATGEVTFDDFGGTSEEQAMISATITKHGDLDTGGTHGSDAVVQSATNDDQDVSSLQVTLAAFGNANNRTAAGFAHSWIETMTPETGYDLMGQRTWRISMLSMHNPDTADTTPTATLAGGSGFVGGIGVELKAA